MSLLLIGLNEEYGPALVKRLIAEGDVVGVIEPDPRRAEMWRDLGAHVAIGTPMDFDLVERAAQHARSIVVLTDLWEDPVSIVDPILTGARLAPGEGARMIFVVERSGGVGETLAESGFDFVILEIGDARSWTGRRKKPAAADVAEAVNAADDLAGSPRLVVDLTDTEDLGRLGL